MQSHCHITELVMATSHKQAPWHQKCKLSSFQQFFFPTQYGYKGIAYVKTFEEKKEVYIEKIYKYPSFFFLHIRYVIEVCVGLSTEYKLNYKEKIYKKEVISVLTSGVSDCRLASPRTVIHVFLLLVFFPPSFPLTRTPSLALPHSFFNSYSLWVTMDKLRKNGYKMLIEVDA